jgi:hypothetical protein
MNFQKQIELHKGGQRAIYLHPARFHIVACGRRFGKTEFGKIVAMKTLFDKDSRYGGYRLPIKCLAQYGVISENQ